MLKSIRKAQKDSRMKPKYINLDIYLCVYTHTLFTKINLKSSSFLCSEKDKLLSDRVGRMELLPLLNAEILVQTISFIVASIIVSESSTPLLAILVFLKSCKEK